MTNTTITGTLLYEPSIRYSREGVAICGLRVAVEENESTSFFQVDCYGTLAENVVLTLTVGMRVMVTGRLVHNGNDVRVEATEVGASLLLATADVNPMPRTVV